VNCLCGDVLESKLPNLITVMIFLPQNPDAFLPEFKIGTQMKNLAQLEAL